MDIIGAGRDSGDLLVNGHNPPPGPIPHPSGRWNPSGNRALTGIFGVILDGWARLGVAFGFGMVVWWGVFSSERISHDTMRAGFG